MKWRVISLIFKNIFGAYLSAIFLPIIIGYSFGWGFSFTEIILESVFPIINDIKDGFENWFMVFLKSNSGFYAILAGAFTLNTLDDLGYPNVKTLIKKGWNKIEDIF